ncbi:hypothetical protein CAOG_03410 [Capsaspora owczarzaki ATCC 30864]|uniref:SPIN90/Ldb17 leucine-rich domain-containing protein n=1 Tax=Capsaspora owczarzaki (strain ATCC 30864) TaxID=595528 RepID=A0A0D2X2E8_CAPO3|nr:hypothetical protein CAOG_03410 [Capsaspora owczarzaki ATCC 30864]KJE92434.1 hypothetical protein CAOG_003410 [Capsaspora owczarzaki ATCC 30864]|eukprot:XP_004364249.2 hypothetical protein CAOG_03410 [Capsaspora owczarzaki ATCC 30864]
MQLVLALKDSAPAAQLAPGFVTFRKNDLMAVIGEIPAGATGSTALTVRTVLGQTGQILMQDVRVHDPSQDAEDDDDDAAPPMLEPVARPSASNLAVAAVPVAPARSPKPQAASEAAAEEVVIHKNLIHLVRAHTGLSFEKSRTAVEAVLFYLQNADASLAGPLTAAVKLPSDLRPNTRDQDRLSSIFAALLAAKNDSQQRNWRSHDDASDLAENLTEMTSILMDTDPDLARAMLSQDDYEIVHGLVDYYMMETRTPLRILVLKSLAVMIKAHERVVSILLSSLLPKELARDILAETIPEIEWLLQAVKVCTMVYSTGEQCPIANYDFWNIEFILHIVNKIENGAHLGFTEEMVDSLIALLLSFNLHFSIDSPSLSAPHRDNIVMKALEQQSSAACLGERVLYMFNRNGRMHSLEKFLKDLFTANFFYSNDLNVLMDIIIRQLENLEQLEERRFESLDILYRLMFVTDYSSTRYRVNDLRTCLTRLGREEANGDAAVAAFSILATKLRDVFCGEE